MSPRLCFTVVPAPPELSLFTAIIKIVIGVVATAGNLSVVVTIIKDPLKELHTPFNYFLLNLALSDLLLGAVSMPVGTVASFQEYLMTMNFDIELFQTMHMTVLISGSASLLSLIALSIERLVAITYSSKHRSIFTFPRCIMVSVGIWIFSVSIPNLYFAWNYIGYVMFFMHAAIFLALIIIAAVQHRIKVFLKARSHQMIEAISATAPQPSIAALEAKELLFQKKISKTYLWILCIFVSVYVPAVVMIYILHFCTSCDCIFRHVLRDLSFLLFCTNSCVNPFIYAIRVDKFRRSLIATFCCNTHRESMTYSSGEERMESQQIECKSNSHSSC